MTDIKELSNSFIEYYPYFEIDREEADKVILNNTRKLPDTTGFYFNPLSQTDQLIIYRDVGKCVKARPNYSIDYFSTILVVVLLYLNAFVFLIFYMAYLGYRYFSVQRAIDKVLEYNGKRPL